jgi:hypothetical protein
MAGVMGIADVLNQWESAGVFDYLLPFILIFSLVFGILRTSKVLGDQKGIHVVIAVVVGLLVLRGGNVQRFFPTIFPNLAIGLTVLLIVMLLVGLFIVDEGQNFRKYIYWGFMAIGVIIAIIVVSNAFEEYGYGSYSFYSGNAGWIIGAVLLVGLIIAVAAGGGGGKPKG